MITPVALFISALSSALNTEAHWRKDDVIMPVANETTLRIKFVDDNVERMTVVYENVVEHESVTLNLFITNTARYTLDHIKRLANSVHYAAAYIDDLGILRIDRYGDPVLTSINADTLTRYPDLFEKIYLSTNRHLLIIYDDQTPVGYAWYESGHHEATILNMFVSPDHRRKSHGSKLMTYIILHAKNMLFHSGNLFADVIYGSPSQPFYSMFDFKRNATNSMFREL